MFIFNENLVKYLITNCFSLRQKDIINRSEFNALMKYENEAFERNFQLKASALPQNEPDMSSSSSMQPHPQIEKTHDDIQVCEPTE